MRTNLPAGVLRAVQSERLALLKRRADAIADFDRQIAELDSFLAGEDAGASAQGHTATVAAMSRPPSLTVLVVSGAIDLLRGGRSMVTPMLRKELEHRGVLVDGDDPDRRITKILSNSGQFKGHRTHGWSLKGEASDAPTSEASSATKAVEANN